MVMTDEQSVETYEAGVCQLSCSEVGNPKSGCLNSAVLEITTMLRTHLCCYFFTWYNIVCIYPPPPPTKI